MRIAIVFFLALTALSCSTTRIETSEIQPESSEISRFPVNAKVLVYLPFGENQKKIIWRYGSNKTHIHKPGEDLEKAGNEVASRYFSQAIPYSPDAPTHYILRLTGSSKLDSFYGSYIVSLKATLYTADGRVIHDGENIENRVTSGLLIDENAFYNAYVGAVKSFLDTAFSVRGDEISTYARNNQPNHFAVEHRKGKEHPLPVVWTGSGFFVNDSGQVVTNAHVASDCLVAAVSVNGEETPAKVAKIDNTVDIAVLETGLSGKNHVLIQRANKVRLGEDIVTVGYPLHGVLADSPTLTTGNISALSGIENNDNLLQVSAPIQTGNSGGPLLNRQGELVGVVQSKLNALGLAVFTGDIAQNVNFAIKTSSLLSLLDNWGVKYTNARATAGRTELAIPDIAEEAVSYTVQVMCRG